MISDRMVAVVMAGGGGTRFWPRSRKSRPKQFLSFDGKESLLTQTIQRLEGLIPPERTVIITGEEHVDLAREHGRVPPQNVIGEPCGRDTAACVGLGTLVAQRLREDAIVVILAADHLIHPTGVFQESVMRAATLASETRSIVTMGLRPDRPATGYGYIEFGARVDDRTPAAYQVVRFREKPLVELAERFVLAGCYLWNSGNLAFRADSMLGALEVHLPDIHRGLTSLKDPRDPSELARVYPSLRSISVDYGILEKTTDSLVVEAPFHWDDLGTFEAVARHAERHGDGNLSRGDALFVNAQNCLVENDHPGLVVISGLEDVLVVRTPDAILVMPRSDSEGVRKIVQAVEQSGHSDRL